MPGNTYGFGSATFATAEEFDVFRQGLRDEHARQQQEHQEATQREARRRRPMTNTISGLGDQIQAALAATRNAQDKALAERRREKELTAAKDEARQARNAGFGG
ncbi:MAG: hypothetical protein WKF39_00625 [Aeromicrobium sp.]